MDSFLPRVGETKELSLCIDPSKFKLHQNSLDKKNYNLVQETKLVVKSSRILYSKDVKGY